MRKPFDNVMARSYSMVNTVRS